LAPSGLTSESRGLPPKAALSWEAPFNAVVMTEPVDPYPRYG